MAKKRLARPGTELDSCSQTRLPRKRPTNAGATPVNPPMISTASGFQRMNQIRQSASDLNNPQAKAKDRPEASPTAGRKRTVASGTASAAFWSIPLREASNIT